MKAIFLLSFREFYLNLKSRGYLIATFGAPLLLLFLSIVFSVQKGIPLKGRSALHLGLLDKTKSFAEPKLFEEPPVKLMEEETAADLLRTFIELPQKWSPVSSREEGMKRIETGELDAVFVIDSRPDSAASMDFVFLVPQQKLNLLSLIPIHRDWLFSRWLREGLGEKRREIFASFGQPQVEWIDDQQQTHKTDYQRAVLSENEKSSWIHVGTFLVALMLLSGYLVTGLSDEREQRSLEFLLSLVSPFQLLSGKLIGVIFSGILQVCTWGLTFVFPALFFFWSMKHAFVNWLLPFFFFLAGYSFYGSILLSLSAAAASARESRQVAASWLFLSCIPLAFYPIILAQPHGSLAHVLSLIPVTAPIAMMLRLGVGQVDFWEYFLSQIILWGCSGLVIRWASSRVLRNLYRKV